MEDFATIFHARIVILAKSTFSMYASIVSQKETIIISESSFKDLEKVTWTNIITSATKRVPRFSHMDDTIDWLENNLFF